MAGTSALYPELAVPPPMSRFRPDEQARIDTHMRLYSTGQLPPLPMPEGELPLQTKLVPLCELPDGPERDAIPLATARGLVDVGPALALLGQLPAGVWHPDEQVHPAPRAPLHTLWLGCVRGWLGPSDIVPVCVRCTNGRPSRTCC